MRTTALTPSLALLLTAFRLEQQADVQACRAADRLLDQLNREPVTFALAGTTLRVRSFGHEPDATYTCTALHCSCRGGRTPWCQHRVLRRVLLARAALDGIADEDGPPERIPCVAPPPSPRHPRAAQPVGDRAQALDRWWEQED